MPILSFKAPDDENTSLKPVITVFGVGGAGSNAVNNMISAELQGANFVIANTDAQSLKNSLCENRIQLGVKLTRGLGAGADPEVGAAAAEESAEDIKEYLKNSNMVFVTAGTGGGTGTGAGPVIARIAKELGILTVGVVTTPFDFEGGHRKEIALSGLAQLYKHVDTLIVIPNQNLFRVANDRTTFADAFKMADDVLHAGVRGVTDLIIMPGLINLDFADIRTIMSKMGKAMMGTGEASGEGRAIKAAEAAINNPLLDHNSMKGAKGVLINITGGNNMTLFEVDSAANRIRNEVGHNGANIIFGSTFNPDLDDHIRVSVVATGIDGDPDDKNIAKTLDNSESEPKKHHNQILDEEVPTFGEYLPVNNVTENVMQSSMANNLSEDQQVLKNNFTSPEQMQNMVRKSEPTKDDFRDYQTKAMEANEVNLPSKAKQHEAVSKPGLFSKMWSSLTREEKTINNHEGKNNQVSPKIENSIDAKDIPTFLRKQK